MGLLNNPAFESEDNTAEAVFAKAATVPTTQPDQQAAAPTQPVQQAAASVPAVTNSTSVTIPGTEFAISLGTKNAIPVGYNTFPQVITSNGNFLDRATKKSLGEMVTFELLSYQDSWVVSPNDDRAPKELVRYSDDNVTCSDGTPVTEHLAFLRAGGYPKAGCKQRAVIVGALLSTSKASELVNQLVQLDLSPDSRSMWQRYLANSIFMLKRGMKTEDQLKQIKATTELVSKGDLTWTKASFAAL